MAVTKTPEALRVEELTHRIAALNKELWAAEQAQADAEALFRPGQFVEWSGKRFVIECVRLKYGRVTYFGKQVKKDGTPGNRVRKLYYFSESGAPKLVEG